MHFEITRNPVKWFRRGPLIPSRRPGYAETGFVEIFYRIVAVNVFPGLKIEFKCPGC